MARNNNLLISVSNVSVEQQKKERITYYVTLGQKHRIRARRQQQQRKTVHSEHTLSHNIRAKDKSNEKCSMKCMRKSGRGWAKWQGYWQRFFTYCSMDYSFRLKRAHNSHHQNETHTHTPRQRIDRTERTEIRAKALRQNFLQYKMLLESLKSVFLFFTFFPWLFRSLSRSLLLLHFFILVVAIVVYRDIVTARRDIQTLLFSSKWLRYLCQIFVVFVIFGCFGNAILLPEKEMRWYAIIMRCVCVCAAIVCWETSKSRGLDPIIWYFIKYLCVVHAFVSSNHEYQLGLKRIHGNGSDRSNSRGDGQCVFCLCMGWLSGRLVRCWTRWNG